MTKKRDAAYYRKRLKAGDPVIYADVVAGRITVRKAALKAGLIHLPTTLGVLKREWRKATISEQEGFLRWAKATTPAFWRFKSSPPKPSPTTIVDSADRLLPPVVQFLHIWLGSRIHAKRGHIMVEMGFSTFDTSLSRAIDGEPLNSEIVPKLEDWLRKNGFRW
jgi:hypothetical protein